MWGDGTSGVGLPLQRQRSRPTGQETRRVGRGGEFIDSSQHVMREGARAQAVGDRVVPQILATEWNPGKFGRRETVRRPAERAEQSSLGWREGASATERNPRSLATEWNSGEWGTEQNPREFGRRETVRRPAERAEQSSLNAVQISTSR